MDTPTYSGEDQKIARSPTCRIALWSNYGGGDGEGPIQIGNTA